MSLAEEINALTQQAKEQIANDLAENKRQKEIAERQAISNRLRSILIGLPGLIRESAQKGYESVSVTEKWERPEVIQGIKDWAAENGFGISKGWDSEMGEGGYSYLIVQWGSKKDNASSQ